MGGEVLCNSYNSNATAVCFDMKMTLLYQPPTIPTTALCNTPRISHHTTVIRNINHPWQFITCHLLLQVYICLFAFIPVYVRASKVTFTPNDSCSGSNIQNEQHFYDYKPSLPILKEVWEVIKKWMINSSLSAFFSL